MSKHILESGVTVYRFTDDSAFCHEVTIHRGCLYYRTLGLDARWSFVPSSSHHSAIVAHFGL